MGSKTPDMPKADPSPYDIAMADIAKKEYDRTDPLRSQMLDQYGGLLSGSTSVYDLPQFKALQEGFDTNYRAVRPQVEGQYNIARENVLGSVPRGGGLTQALTNVESNRARSVSDLAYERSNAAQQMIMDMLNKAYSYVTGSPMVSISGYGQAANNVSAQRIAQLGATRSFMDTAGQVMSLGQQGSKGGKNK